MSWLFLWLSKLVRLGRCALQVVLAGELGLYLKRVFLVGAIMRATVDN